MAAITENRADGAAPSSIESPSQAPEPRSTLRDLPAKYWWGGGIALVLVVMVVSLVAWGPGMEYPTTVAHVKAWETVEDKANYGHRLNINVIGTINGESAFERHYPEYDLSEDNDIPFPGFAAVLLGMSQGEERKFTATMPDDVLGEQYAGREIQFSVSVESVKESSTSFPRSLRDVTGDAIDAGTKWLTVKGAWLFGGIKTAITYALNYLEDGLKWLPWPALVLGLTLASFAVGRWAMMIFTAFAFLFIGFMGLWEPMIDTVALMVVAVLLSVGIGLPLGVLGARNSTADRIMRPILDGMQTMPSFVYLLPGILFFGLGKPAGIFATIIYAVPPVIRLTNLGIRQVSPETVEAARSFGASPLQLLTRVQVPMALPTIMAGVNQTTMMALAMVTIASMVAAGGLGDNVLRAIQKNEVGNGVIAGLSIVFMAIVIDRLTQAVARGRQEALSAGH